MVNASRSGERWGRKQTLILSGLLLAGLLCIVRVDAAPDSPAPADKSKAKAPPAANVPWPTAPRLTIVSEGSDVPEMVKLINEKLEANWKANKVVPSRYVDDYEFIRRASLDIIGRIATTAEIKRYMNHPQDKRRSMLIEELLKHEDYARHWAGMWSNWLLTRSGDFGRGKYHDAMTVWLEDQFAQNRSAAELVTKLLTAKGKNDENGATNFILAHMGEQNPAGKQKEEGQFEMVPLTSRLTRVFLGTQVQCAQCHAHPFFTALTQKSFWGINAFLRQVKKEGQPRMRNNRMAPLPTLTLSDNEDANENAKVYFEMRSGKFGYQKAEFLPTAGKERPSALDPSLKGVARREALAKFIVEHDQFPRAMVNRIWGLMLGRGFVNPIDDFNDNNQPSNPELLQELASKFKHYSFDFKKLIRWVAHSNAYQLSYVANRSNDKSEHETLFARMTLKALSPEQLLESLVTATKMEQGSTAAKKKELRDKWIRALIANFGDDEGNEVNFNGTIVQALMMMNGKDINDAISADKGTVNQILLKNPRASIDELYLAALNRPARRNEVAGIQNRIRLRAGFKDNVKAQYQDIFWALLNSNEFLLNH
jgi:hypothetical protein